MPDPLVTPWTASVLRPLPGTQASPCFPLLARAEVDPATCCSGTSVPVSLWSRALPVPHPLPLLGGLPTLAPPAVPRPRAAAAQLAAL